MSINKLPSQQPAIVETGNPASASLLEQNYELSPEHQRVDQGHRVYSSGASSFVHDFGLQLSYPESYSDTPRPSMHSNTSDPAIENAAGAGDVPGGQPQSTRRQQSAIPDTFQHKKWDDIPLFLQNALKDALVVSHTQHF
jgi:hypothetical protein